MSYKYDHNRDFISKIAPHEYSASEIEEAKKDQSSMPKQANPEPLPRANHPVSISILIGYLALSLVSTSIKSWDYLVNPTLPVWFKICVVISILLGLGTIVGLWRMRRWGVVCYFFYILLVVLVYIDLSVSLINIYVILPLLVFAFMCSKLSLLK